MILDRIENASLYENLSDKISEGLNYIKKTDLLKLAPGNYNISEGIFVIVSEYTSKNVEDCKLEAHKKYIDIQYMINGEELIGYAPLRDQVPSVAYNNENDVAFYREEVSFTKLEQGMFAIYFPDDLHMPGVKSIKNTLVKKVVVKIEV